MWHKTHDMWHVICDMWQTLCQNFRSLALRVWELWCFEDWEEKGHWLSNLINEWINYVAVCRTALATPGLLKISIWTVHYFINWNTNGLGLADTWNGCQPLAGASSNWRGLVVPGLNWHGMVVSGLEWRPLNWLGPAATGLSMTGSPCTGLGLQPLHPTLVSLISQNFSMEEE